MASYEGFLKLRAVGVAGGQDINNTFYYGGEAGDVLVFNDAFMAVFAAAWQTAYVEDYLGEQTTRYTMTQIEVSAIDRHGVTISDNTVELGVNLPGDIDLPIPGPGVSAVISIKTSSVEIEASRSLKRSYLAWGPVPSQFITDPTGELTLTAKAAYANIAAMVADSLVIAGVEYWPMRIGRTAPSAQPAFGTILSVNVKPYWRPRTSRMFSSDGT